MPAMDMWAAGVLLCSCPEVMLAFESKRLPCGESLSGFLASLAWCRLPVCMFLLDLRYLLFTGDCPIQQEDMQKLATKGPAGKDLVLKAAFVESESSSSAKQNILQIGEVFMPGFGSRPLEICLQGGHPSHEALLKMEGEGKFSVFSQATDLLQRLLDLEATL